MGQSINYMFSFVSWTILQLQRGIQLALHLVTYT
jgi:hypothetical protein